MSNMLFNWEDAGDVITGINDYLKPQPKKKVATVYSYDYDRKEYMREYYLKNRKRLLKKANARYKPKKKRKKNGTTKTNV